MSAKVQAEKELSNSLDESNADDWLVIFMGIDEFISP